MTTGLVDYEVEFARHLTDKASVEYILREGIALELFYQPVVKSLIQFVTHYFNQSGKIPTVTVLQTEFPNFEFITPEATIEFLIEKLRERYQRNRVSDLVQEVARKSENPKEAMNHLKNQVLEIDKATSSHRNSWTNGDSKIFLKRLSERIEQGFYDGYSCGFPEIDKFTGGIKKGNLAYFLARPKRKKTFFTLNSFLQHIRMQSNPILFTLENTEEEIVNRLGCMISGVSWDRMQKGALMKGDYEDLHRAWDELDQWGPWHVVQPELDDRTVASMTLHADKVGAQSMFISQFKYIDGVKDFYRNDTEKHAEIAVDLKRAAIRPGRERAIIVEAQFNRGGDSMDDIGDFDASKVGLTDMIPQAADTLYGLFETKDMRANGMMQFGILEARNHDRGSWHVSVELRTHTEFTLVPDSFQDA